MGQGDHGTVTQGNPEVPANWGERITSTGKKRAEFDLWYDLPGLPVPWSPTLSSLLVAGSSAYGA